MRLRAWPLIHPSPAIKRLMISWFVLGKDNFRRDADDTSVPFVGLQSKPRAQSSRSLAKKEAAPVLMHNRSSVQHHATFDQLAHLRIVGDEHHRPGFLLGAESAQ